MSIEQEKQFEHLVPMKSVLGREFLALQAERDKCKLEFEASPDKMAADTLAYRRSEIALARFLDDMLKRILETKPRLDDARERLEIAEAKAQNNSHGHGINLDRRSMVIIWTRFAIDRYRLHVSKDTRKQVKQWHPELWKELGNRWMEFRKQLKKWQFGGQPFDGSQAMHSMIAFFTQAHQIKASND